MQAPVLLLGVFALQQDPLDLHPRRRASSATPELRLDIIGPSENEEGYTEMLSLASFGQTAEELAQSAGVMGPVVGMTPATACIQVLANAGQLSGAIALVLRGGCPFADKARAVQEAGAVAMLLIDSQPSSEPIQMRQQSSNETGEAAVVVPVVSVTQQLALEWMPHLANLTVRLRALYKPSPPPSIPPPAAPPAPPLPPNHPPLSPPAPPCGTEGRIDLQTLVDAGTISAPTFCFKVPVLAECEQYYFISTAYDNKTSVCYLNADGKCKGRFDFCNPPSSPPAVEKPVAKLRRRPHSFPKYASTDWTSTSLDLVAPKAVEAPPQQVRARHVNPARQRP
jgi:hypothetical protein